MFLLRRGAGSASSNYRRQFLASVDGSGIGYRESLKFDYNGLQATSGLFYNALPDSSSKQLDRWGYFDGNSNNNLLPEVHINTGNTNYERFRYNYNPALSSVYPYSLSGRSREPVLSTTEVGALNKVNNANGGITTIAYELNSYCDPQTGDDAPAGGLRVKTLNSYDVETPSVVLTQNYTYTNPNTGKSSGKPVSLPVYAFLRPYTGGGTSQQQWENSIVRSNENLSTGGDDVLYEYVKETTAGAGSKVYNYYLPPTHFDASVSPDWSPMLTYVAACNGGGFLTNENRTYPFIQPMDFDYDHPLPKNLSMYNGLGQKVSETNYTYTRIGTAAYIPAFRWELNSGITTYSRYRHLTGVSRQLSVHTESLNDLASGLAQNQTVNTYYESSTHQYPTRTETVNSVGETEIRKVKYVKDFNLAAAYDQETIGLKKLYDQGINIPVEQLSQKNVGGTIYTIGASLTKFKSFPSSLNLERSLPAQSLSLVSANGMTNFQQANTVGGYFSSDSRYVVQLNQTDYSDYGMLTGYNDNRGNYSSSVYTDVNLKPIALFNGAGIAEAFYADFDNSGMAASPSSYTRVTGRTGVSAVELQAGQSLSRNVTKKTGANLYHFSAWIKTGSSANLQVDLLSGSTLLGSHFIPFTSSGGEWKYYSLNLPVSNITGIFTLKIQSAVALQIDDVVLRPTDAAVSTVQYDDEFGYTKRAQTDGSGRTSWFNYDQYNRPTQVLDQDKNLVLQKSYVDRTDLIQYAALINHDPNLFAGVSAGFSDSYTTPSPATTSYTWNFGDGTIITTTGQFATSYHTYTSAGTYTVTLTKSSPLYGTTTATKTIVVGNPAVAIQSGGGIDQVRFYQGSTLVATFTDSEMASNTAQLASGTYQVVVTASGQYSPANPSGYRSVIYHAYSAGNTNHLTGCSSSSPDSQFTTLYSVNLAGKSVVTFYISDQECTLSEL